MDLIKIGKYIAGKRKEQELTQRQLADQLGMSDKSVSKWERGICLPDVSIYMELCNILGITLNEFIAGEDISENNVIQKSEDNLIQVTAAGDSKRRRLKWMIAVLLCITIVVTSVLGYVAYKNGVWKRNYVEPVSKKSAEMKMAEVLSGVDGAFLYKYAADESYQKITLYLSIYEEGTLVSESECMSVSLAEKSMKEGMIAIVPDFEAFKVNTIIANDSAKSSTDIPILEDVKEKEYYGRTASEIEHKVDIENNTKQGLLTLIYGKDGVSSTPIEMVGNEDAAGDNDYMYYFSFEFSKEK